MGTRIVAARNKQPTRTICYTGITSTSAPARALTPSHDHILTHSNTPRNNPKSSTQSAGSHHPLTLSPSHLLTLSLVRLLIRSPFHPLYFSLSLPLTPFVHVCGHERYPGIQKTLLKAILYLVSSPRADTREFQHRIPSTIVLALPVAPTDPNPSVGTLGFVFLTSKLPHTQT